jgi:microcystin-dependent protein
VAGIGGIEDEAALRAAIQREIGSMPELIRQLQGRAMRAGDLRLSAALAVPSGWLDCDGSFVQQATYPDLFAALGHAWNGGTDPGDGTFKVPDLRGRTLIGAGTGSGLTARALAASGGEESHRLSVAEMPSHAHQEIARFGGSGAANGLTLNTVSNAVFGAVDNTGASGGDGAHTTMQPFAAVRMLVKV